MKTYEKTKHPRIYKNSYWGWFNEFYQDAAGAYHTNDTCKPEIIQARNEFVENNNIVAPCDYRCMHALQDSSTGRLDHLESYRSKDGKIFVFCSNYDDHKYPLSIGFIPCKNMYSTAAKTYMRIFQDLNELKEVCKNIRT
jgi:hypothetical protein